jgi:septum formation protein
LSGLVEQSGMADTTFDAPTLVLASTSPYRRELMDRLRWPYRCVAPDVDETPLDGEAPQALAVRLARLKALTVARTTGVGVGEAPGPQASLVIGSDQVLELDGRAWGKPGSHERAVEQLRHFSGREMVFHTAVAVCRSPDLALESLCVPVRVTMRALSEDEIQTYLRLDAPYDCAGSAKCETLGIALLDAVVSDDPTALVGLPLVATTRLLRHFGLNVLLRSAG